MIQRARKEVFGLFWSSVCWVDLIFHIVIVLNVFHHFATLPGHEGSFKNHNAFLNDPKCQKGFLNDAMNQKVGSLSFSGVFCWIDLFLFPFSCSFVFLFLLSSSFFHLCFFPFLQFSLSPFFLIFIPSFSFLFLLFFFPDSAVH